MMQGPFTLVFTWNDTSISMFQCEAPEKVNEYIDLNQYLIRQHDGHYHVMVFYNGRWVEYARDRKIEE